MNRFRAQDRPLPGESDVARPVGHDLDARKRLLDFAKVALHHAPAQLGMHLGAEVTVFARQRVGLGVVRRHVAEATVAQVAQERSAQRGRQLER